MQRIRPTWLSDADDDILELLAQTGVALNKRGLEVNLDIWDTPVPYSTLKRRVDKLSDAGFLEDAGETGSYYRITERGCNYLIGEPYGAENFPDVTVEDTPEWHDELLQAIDPVAFTILEEMEDAMSDLSASELIRGRVVSPDRAQKRFSALDNSGFIYQTETGWDISFTGKSFLTTFTRGKEVLSVSDISSTLISEYELPTSRD